MSKIMCFLDRSLNATHMPIPICCVESEENREKEKQSQRGEGEGSVDHTKVTIRVTRFLPLGHVTLMEPGTLSGRAYSSPQEAKQEDKTIPAFERKRFVLHTV